MRRLAHRAASGSSFPRPCWPHSRSTAPSPAAPARAPVVHGTPKTTTRRDESDAHWQTDRSGERFEATSRAARQPRCRGRGGQPPLRARSLEPGPSRCPCRAPKPCARPSRHRAHDPFTSGLRASPYFEDDADTAGARCGEPHCGDDDAAGPASAAGDERRTHPGSDQEARRRAQRRAAARDTRPSPSAAWRPPTKPKP